VAAAVAASAVAAAGSIALSVASRAGSAALARAADDATDRIAARQIRFRKRLLRTEGLLFRFILLSFPRRRAGADGCQHLFRGTSMGG
jgi:hypothetical protein